MGNEDLLTTHPTTWRLRAQRMQWFGLALLFLAAALAALTDFLAQEGGTATLVAFAVAGLLALVIARLILARPRPAQQRTPSANDSKIRSG